LWHTLNFWLDTAKQNPTQDLELLGFHVVNSNLRRQPQTAYAFSELRCSFAGQSLVPDVAVYGFQDQDLAKHYDVI
jgi:hypothetical protein